MTHYASSVFEGARNDNNLFRGDIGITYREPDLTVTHIVVSDPNPHSGQTISVTWTVTNQGARETRVNGWYDGLYLSRDASLDTGDFALVDRGLLTEVRFRIKSISLPERLKPGESYTASATFQLPESFSGDFKLIVHADTSIGLDRSGYTPSTVRDGLAGLALFIDASGSVPEFQDEGNNTSAIDLPITLALPPDLQVARVEAPDKVLAGQSFTVDYQVINAGGDTVSDQSVWNDLIYLSRDRFLDVNKDRYLGYIEHTGGLTAGAAYSGHRTFTAPSDLEGAYYVFVITDPAYAFSAGEFGRVREFGLEQNNAAAADQPILIETPPPADLKVLDVTLPGRADITLEQLGDATELRILSEPKNGKLTKGKGIYIYQPNIDSSHKDRFTYATETGTGEVHLQLQTEAGAWKIAHVLHDALPNHDAPMRLIIKAAKDAPTLILTDVISSQTGQRIALPSLEAHADDDKAKLNLTLTQLPQGSILSDGLNTFTARETNAVDITGWNLHTLTLANFTGSFTLNIHATESREDQPDAVTSASVKLSATPDSGNKRANAAHADVPTSSIRGGETVSAPATAKTASITVRSVLPNPNAKPKETETRYHVINLASSRAPSTEPKPVINWTGKAPDREISSTGWIPQLLASTKEKVRSLAEVTGLFFPHKQEEQ
jgi:hypothetical protein